MSPPISSSGANALAVDAAYDPNASQEFPAVRTAAGGRPQQSALFGSPAPKVIPFPSTVAKSVPPPAAAPVQVRKSPAPQQTALDFLDTAAAPRTLRNDVPAQIFCEQAVAAPMHRLVAGSIDAAIIMLGFGIFVGIAQLAGSSFGTGRLFWIVVGAAFTLISIFYGLVCSITGRETAGMRFTGLQLITFDGLPVEGRVRAVRFAATWLSFCSGGLGLLWALADEENLTWHDHISRSFPAIADAPATVVRRG